MPEQYYTTEETLDAKRAEMWRNFISETFVELDCDGMAEDDFFGEVRARSLGDLNISAITTDAYDVFRTTSSIAKSRADDFLVSVQTQGTSVIRQLGREAILQPGDFTIYDSTVPYHLHFENRLSQLVVQIPREMLKGYFSVPEALTALPYRGEDGMAAITTNFAQTAFEQSLQLDGADQERIAKTFMELLTASIRGSVGTPDRQPLNRATQLIRIKAMIAERLKDPSLSPKLLAKANGISVRYLQMLFESEEFSPAKYIWDQRLQRAKWDLENPALVHRSVSQICYSWAFGDIAHFSRVFKARFGISPRAYRTQIMESKTNT